MRGPVGRVLRIVLGIALAWWGFTSAGWLIGIIGVTVIAAGTFNFCIFAPLFGRTIWGKVKAA